VLGAVGFDLLVFRRAGRWAQTLCVALGVALVVGWLGDGLGEGFAHGRARVGWDWLLYGGYVAAAVWVLAEPLRYHAVMRRRLRLGLADPAVLERLWPWGLGSAFRLVTLVVGAFAMVVVETSPDLAERIVTPTFLIFGAAGLGVAGAYLRAFLPSSIGARAHAFAVEPGRRPARRT
jgi:hypothetical protein